MFLKKTRWRPRCRIAILQFASEEDDDMTVPRFYGLSVWFPDVIKHLQADEYASRVKIHNNERIEDFTFNFTLENQIHRNGLFLNDRLECNSQPP